MGNIVDVKVSDELIIINVAYKGIIDDEISNVAAFNLKTKELIAIDADEKEFKDLHPKKWDKLKDEIYFSLVFNVTSFNAEAAARLLWYWWNENIHQLASQNPELNIQFKDYENIPIETQHKFEYLVYQFLRVKELRINSTQKHWSRKNSFPSRLLTWMKAIIVCGLFALLVGPIFDLAGSVTDLDLPDQLETMIFALLSMLFIFLSMLASSFFAAFLWILILRPFFSNELLELALEYQDTQPQKHPIGKLEKNLAQKFFKSKDGEFEKAMEIGELVSALEEVLIHLRNSESSDYAHMPVDEVISKLEHELAKADNSKPVDLKLLSFLFAPTGAIQETAIDNGWGNEYLGISAVIDQYIEQH